MGRRVSRPLPPLDSLLEGLGQHLKRARQRRGITAQLLAQRAGMSRPTLHAVERGDAGVTLGSVANVLLALGLEHDLASIGRDDVLGRKLEDARLEERQRVRVSRASDR